jgi:hypothetical protein
MARRLWLVTLAAVLAACAGSGGSEEDETPGLAGISFHIKADAANDLHAVYRGYAPGDAKRPDGWTRVYYRRFDSAQGRWSSPLQVNDAHTPNDTSTRFNQPRVAPMPGSSRVAVAWTLDFRRTRGVLLGIVETAAAAPAVLTSTDVFGDSAEWEIKQLGLEAASASELSLFWTLITPRQNEVWETPVTIAGTALQAGQRRFVGSPTGQHIATAPAAGGRLFVSSTFGTNRNNLLLASRQGTGPYAASRLSVEGALGVTGLLPRPDGSALDLVYMSAFEHEARHIGVLHLEAGSRRVLGTTLIDRFVMTPERVESISAAQSPGGRQAAAWGRGETRQAMLFIREPGEAWPAAAQIGQRAIVIPEADNPAVAFSGETLHVVYRDLSKNGTSHRSYAPGGAMRLEPWDTP